METTQAHRGLICMVAAGAGLIASQLLKQLLRDLGPCFPPRRRQRPDATAPRQPESFLRFEDAARRFELSYPSDWNASATPGFQATSPQTGTFARVDLLGPTVDLWRPMEIDFAPLGPRLSVRKRSLGSPERAEGELALPARRLAWTAVGWTVGETKVALLLGRVVSPRPRPTMAAYQKTILAAIRRHFKLGPGLRG